VSEESSILVGCLGSVAWVRVQGTANHENANCIRQFLRSRFEKGWRKFVVDLEESKGIDSTFIGMLYQLAADVAEEDEEDGLVEIINPGERNERSIRKLGLDALIQIDSDGLRWKEERELVRENMMQPVSCPPVSKQAHTEMVLEAHEALAAANEENEKRFCDVLEFLRQDLETQKTEN